MKAGRQWLPLDAGFWRDPQVLEAGERAAVLYLAMLCQLRTTGAHGVLSLAEIRTLGISGWQGRLARLLAVGLVEKATDTVVHVPAWEAWQPNRSRAAYMRTWRARTSNRARLSQVGSDDDDEA